MKNKQKYFTENRLVWQRSGFEGLKKTIIDSGENVLPDANNQSKFETEQQKDKRPEAANDGTHAESLASLNALSQKKAVQELTAGDLTLLAAGVEKMKNRDDDSAFETADSKFLEEHIEKIAARKAVSLNPATEPLEEFKWAKTDNRTEEFYKPEAKKLYEAFKKHNPEEKYSEEISPIFDSLREKGISIDRAAFEEKFAEIIAAYVQNEKGWSVENLKEEANEAEENDWWDVFGKDEKEALEALAKIQPKLQEGLALLEEKNSAETADTTRITGLLKIINPNLVDEENVSPKIIDYLLAGNNLESDLKKAAILQKWPKIEATLDQFNVPTEQKEAILKKLAEPESDLKKFEALKQKIEDFSKISEEKLKTANQNIKKKFGIQIPTLSELFVFKQAELNLDLSALLENPTQIDEKLTAAQTEIDKNLEEANKFCEKFENLVWDFFLQQEFTFDVEGEKITTKLPVDKLNETQKNNILSKVLPTLSGYFASKSGGEFKILGEDNVVNPQEFERLQQDPAFQKLLDKDSLPKILAAKKAEDLEGDNKKAKEMLEGMKDFVCGDAAEATAFRSAVAENIPEDVKEKIGQEHFQKEFDKAWKEIKTGSFLAGCIKMLGLFMKNWDKIIGKISSGFDKISEKVTGKFDGFLEKFGLKPESKDGKAAESLTKFLGEDETTIKKIIGSKVKMSAFLDGKTSLGNLFGLDGGADDRAVKTQLEKLQEKLKGNEKAKESDITIFEFLKNNPDCLNK